MTSAATPVGDEDTVNDYRHPEACYSALWAFSDPEDRSDVSADDTIERIARPLIAAELRRWADHWWDEAQIALDEGDGAASRALSRVGRRTERSADELDPPEVDVADGLPVTPRER